MLKRRPQIKVAVWRGNTGVIHLTSQKKGLRLHIHIKRESAAEKVLSDFLDEVQKNEKS